MHPLRIMIVDDEPGLAEAIAALLGMDGHDAYSAISGQQALEQVSAGNRIDLLISDLVMPGMSGIELNEELRRRKLSPFRFVLLTGSPPALVKRVARGALTLFKPASADDLRRVAADCAAEMRGMRLGQTR